VSGQLWSVRDVARFLGVPAKTIYTWRACGEGPPCFRVGKHLRFRPSEVEAWLETHRDEDPQILSGPRGRWEASGYPGA
jgi:excisionase family DNA binding protein